MPARAAPPRAHSGLAQLLVEEDTARTSVRERGSLSVILSSSTMTASQSEARSRRVLAAESRQLVVTAPLIARSSPERSKPSKTIPV